MPPEKSDRRRAIKRGEALAIDPQYVKRDGPGAYFFLFGPSVAPNERVGEGDSIAVVNVRGPLDQFADSWGDNYESIVDRVREAMRSEDYERKVKRDRQEAYWRGDVDDIDRSPIESSPPVAVVLRMSSPGGVVAGLNQTVHKLRAMSVEHGIPLIAYVDEMAASAAYALACACDEIYLPPSGVVGSIGVISHMFSIARANEEDGIDVEVIASGDHKTDCNENLPITDGAKSRERARVMKLAGQFFRLVAKARGISADEVAQLEAGIFLGKDGVNRSLADGVIGWDDFISEISLAHNASGVTDSKAQGGTRGTPQRSGRMGLQALIAETKKQLATATGAAREQLQAKLSRLQAAAADVEAYKKTKYTKEEETSEEDDDKKDDESEEDDPPEKDSEGDEDDKDAASDEDEKKSESEESDEDAESEDDKKESKDDDAEEEALLASLPPDMRGRLAAKLGDARAGRKALARVAKIERDRKHEKQVALIDRKLAGHFITKKEASWLKKQPIATVESFLAMRKKPILRTDETAEIPADTGRPDAAAHLSDAEFAQIRQAHLATGGRVPLEKFIADYRNGAGRPNGIAGPQNGVGR